MKISYNWLNNYVSLEGVSPIELADALTNAGLEVEETSYMAQGTNLVIGEVLKCEPHPDSDHLNITEVEYGEGPVQIVCGAPNCKKGIKVIVAKIGAVLPEVTIKKAKVRGVESSGMLCSLRELGVNEAYLTEEQLNGIEILPEDAPVGCTDVLKYLGLDDAILDVSQTPNRADFMSMWAVSKEVGAILHREVKLPECAGYADQFKTHSDLKVVSKTDKCPHIMGKIINDVTIKESPKWMRDYLHAAGMNSINNVVDISNYVMLETGQPLHFYDLNKVKNKEICVEDQLNTKIETLDGFTYDIHPDDLIITMNNEPVGIAGIIGGEDSKIDDNTKGIIIESALFNHVSIRNTTKRLGFISDAANRFIKGLEPLAQIKAMDRACQLLVEYADAKLIEETKSCGEVNYQPIVVKETLTHCNQLLGTDYTMDQVYNVLKDLDFKPVVDGDEVTCTIPSYRTDIFIREDLDEEIIRLIGYDTLKETLPTMVATQGRLSYKQNVRRTTKQILNGNGISEVINYTLVSKKYVDNAVMPFGEHISLLAPMSEERRYVRNSLCYSMLNCYSYNSSYKNNNVNIFEISNVYEKDALDERVAILLSGSLQESKLNKINVPSDFYTLKGIILNYLKKLGYQEKRISIIPNTVDTKNFHPYRSACVMMQNQLIGIFGDIHPTVLKEFNVSKCVYAELSLTKLLSMKPSKVMFEPIDKYPSVKRDIALVVSKDVLASDLTKTISMSSKLIKNIEIFDVYEGEHVSEGQKSIALSIVYQSSDHTLKEDEINDVHNKVLENLNKKCGASLRS